MASEQETFLPVVISFVWKDQKCKFQVNAQGGCKVTRRGCPDFSALFKSKKYTLVWRIGISVSSPPSRLHGYFFFKPWQCVCWFCFWGFLKPPHPDITVFSSRIKSDYERRQLALQAYANILQPQLTHLISIFFILYYITLYHIEPLNPTDHRSCWWDTSTLKKQEEAVVTSGHLLLFLLLFLPSTLGGSI